MSEITSGPIVAVNRDDGEARMRRQIQTGLFFLTTFVCSAGLVAQDRPTDSNSSTAIILGCVQRVDQSGTLGTTIPERAATPESAGVLANLGEPGPGFLLADAALESAAGVKIGIKADLPKRYVLVGGENDLAKREGQRVRVTGTVFPSTKPADQPVGTSGSNQIKSETRRLKVAAIETVPGDCSPRKQ